MPWEKYNFSDDLQDAILACVVRYPEQFDVHGDLIEAKIFNGVAAVSTVHNLKEYVKKYGQWPNFTTLANFCHARDARLNPDKARENFDYVCKLANVDTSDKDAVFDLVRDFAKERALYLAIRKAHSALMEGKEVEGGMIPMFEKALNVGSAGEDMGLILQNDYEHVLDDYGAADLGVGTGYAPFNEIWKVGWGVGWLIVPLAPPKCYKCLGKGTGIVMFDGSAKPVEQIKVGDLIMGDDSTPRKVMTCGSGYGPLYSVKQASGKDFVCNDAHILCIRFPDGRIKEMPVKDYAKQKPWFKRQWQGYKTGVHFPEQPVPLDPYFLGLWLGDGTSAAPEICVADGDSEIADYLQSYAAKLDLRLTFEPGQGCRQFRFVKTPKRSATCTAPGCSEPHRAGGLCHKHYCQAYYHGFRAAPDGEARWTNPVTSALKTLGVFENKHIPDVYKINSRATRLELLAGLTDSDGNFTKKRGFVLNLTNHRLAEAVCWLARSLGFLVSIKPYKTTIKSTGYTGQTWRVTITGDTSVIPTLLPRKRGVDSFKHQRGRCKIEATPIGNGEYWGFTIDGNNRFLLDDFTVAHNTTFCINLALNMSHEGANTGSDVIYYACEISQKLAAIRALCNISGYTHDDLYGSKEKFKQQVKEQIGQFVGKVLFKGFSAKQASISQIKMHARKAIKMFGLKPKAIFIDYAETVRPEAVSKDTPDWRQQADIYVQARALGNELGCSVIMPDRCKAEFVDRRVPSMNAFQGSFEKAGVVDCAIGLCQTDAEHIQNRMRYFIFLNRHGRQGVQFEGVVDPERFRMSVEREIPYNPQDEEFDRPKRGGRKRRVAQPEGMREAADAVQEETAATQPAATKLRQQLLGA